MPHNTLQALPLSCSDFSLLRQAGMIYVDKSELICRLCSRINAQIFLARPRRFGKSLLVSTFESLFKFGLRDFHGLAIEKIWTDDGKYDVIRLDFSELVGMFTSLEEFRAAMVTRIFAQFSPIGLRTVPDSKDPGAQFSAWLTERSNNSLVLLIDEYDAPLTSCLHQPALFSQIQQELSNFYLILKSKSSRLRFLFMTGVTKFSNTGIFSGFNSLDDISLYSEYGTLLGYTQEELHRHFSSYLEFAADKLELTSETLLERLRANYDGFCFDARAQTHVYCPWSVLKFLNQPQEGFKNYWYTSAGRPSVLSNYLKLHELADPGAYASERLTTLENLTCSQSYPNIDANVLLTEAGYLTIREVAPNETVTLGYPNNEVATSMAKLYATELLGGKAYKSPFKTRLVQTLACDTLDAIVLRFNAAFNSLDYVRFFITNEASCRAALQLIMIGAEAVPAVEVHSALGRSDLEVNAGDRHWVFELKLAEKPEEALRLLTSGIEQVKANHYGETAHDKKLMRAVLVFSAQERRFSAWAMADDGL